MQQWEKLSAGLADASFSNIERQTWQPVSPDTWRGPAIEQLISSGSRGILTMLAGFGASAIASTIEPRAVAPSLGASVLAALLITAYDFQAGIDDRYETVRNQEVSRELYEKQTNAGAAASRETVILEHHYRDDDGNIRRIEFDELPTTRENLAIIFREYEAGRINLSKSGLREAINIGDQAHANILSAMEKLGYIEYPGSRNDPSGAHYTPTGRRNSRLYLTYLLALAPVQAAKQLTPSGVGGA